MSVPRMTDSPLFAGGVPQNHTGFTMPSASIVVPPPSRRVPRASLLDDDDGREASDAYTGTGGFESCSPPPEYLKKGSASRRIRISAMPGDEFGGEEDGKPAGWAARKTTPEHNFIESNAYVTDYESFMQPANGVSSSDFKAPAAALVANDRSSQDGLLGYGEHLDSTFTRQVDDPDRRYTRSHMYNEKAKARGWTTRTGHVRGDKWDEFHRSLLVKASKLKLEKVEQARVLYASEITAPAFPVRRSILKDAILKDLKVMMAVGSHYSERLFTPAEFYVHCIHTLPNEPFMVVYTHSGVDTFGAMDTIKFIRQLYSAIGKRHRDDLHAIVIVHPTMQLRGIIMAMQVVEWEFCQKVMYASDLIELQGIMRNRAILLDLPAHIDDYVNETMQ